VEEREFSTGFATGEAGENGKAEEEKLETRNQKLEIGRQNIQEKMAT